jgi:CheY-like chemotaxis protein
MVSRKKILDGTEGRRAIAPIIVADDDAGSAVATTESLSARGHGAIAESNGDEVLRRVHGSLTRMVVAELYIPCAEGRCVVTALKKDRTRLPRLRVLVHTRHMQPVDVEWALASGADTIVNKGAAPEVLVFEVERLIGDGA